MICTSMNRKCFSVRLAAWTNSIKNPEEVQGLKSSLLHSSFLSFHVIVEASQNTLAKVQINLDNLVKKTTKV